MFHVPKLIVTYLGSSVDSHIEPNSLIQCKLLTSQIIINNSNLCIRFEKFDNSQWAMQNLFKV